MISGQFLTSLVGRFFWVVGLPLRFLLLCLRILNKTLAHFVFSRIDGALARGARERLAKTTSVDPRVILFIEAPCEYTGDAKYITEELLKRGSAYNLVWAVSPASRGPFPSELSFVGLGSEEFYKTAAHAKIIVQNGHTLQSHSVTQNVGQSWVQAGHGPSGFEGLGNARNDILLDRSAETVGELRRKVLTRLNVSDTGQNFLLFAPAPDENSLGQSFGSLNFEGVREALGNKFGGTWEFLVRADDSKERPSTQSIASLPLYCHNASLYPDAQELMMVARVGVTDHSSWIDDYILTRKPAFLYDADARTREIDGSFFHGFETMPLNLATCNAELISYITEFDQDSYETRVEDFLEQAGSADDGGAASRVVDHIEELMAR